MADLQHAHGRCNDRLLPDGLVQSLRPEREAPKIEWSSAKWLFPYLVGLGVISYFGGFGHGGIIGGVGTLKNVLIGGNADLPLTGTSSS